MAHPVVYCDRYVVHCWRNCKETCGGILNNSLRWSNNDRLTRRNTVSVCWFVSYTIV